MSDEQGLYYQQGVPLPETPVPGDPPQPWGKTNVVGQKQRRVDAYERVSGTAVYPSDIVLPRMLYGAVLRCPYPHARIAKIDTSAAEKLPGVHAVITGQTAAADLDWRYRDGRQTKIFDPHCRFEGEAIAAVALADDEDMSIRLATFGLLSDSARRFRSGG